MNKTKPTLARQTFEKVCAIETILNSLLADSSPPVSGPQSPVTERPLYLATAGPEMPPFGHPLGGRARLSALF